MSTEQRPAEPAYLSPADIVDNARRLAAALPDRAAEIERQRRLPMDLVAQLRAAGVFRMAMPRTWGGPEMTPRQMCDVVEILAMGDGSVGWCGGIGADSGIYSAFLDDGAARDLYPTLDLSTAGAIFPAGQAHQTDEGFRISGRWSFGSGITHADRVVCGCIQFAGGAPVLTFDGKPSWRVGFVPVEQVRVIDTWRTTGLLGTGSHDYEVDSVLVPAAHTFSFFSGARRPGLLYQQVRHFLDKIPGVPLGVAQAALDFSRSFLREKREPPTMRPVAESGRVQANLARAEALVGASRAYVHRTLDDEWASLEAGDEPAAGTVALARQFAFQACREAVQLLYDTVGAAAIYTERTPLDRQLRDLITASEHVSAQDRMREWIGELRLGGRPTFPFL